jgi:amphi-Trp domain-containing protein
MADVKFEHKEALSREQAAIWLTALSRAFSHGGEVKLPVGAGTLGLHLPDHVEAEFEVEVEGDEVQVELEFTWSTAKGSADT